MPFSVKVNEKGQPIVWAGTVSGQYVKMNNHEGACDVNPDDVLNLSFNVSHLLQYQSHYSTFFAVPQYCTFLRNKKRIVMPLQTRLLCIANKFVLHRKEGLFAT